MKIICFYTFYVLVFIILYLEARRICEHFNPYDCLSSAKCNVTQTCSESNLERWHCYALWTNVSGKPVILMKGCWLDKDYCYDKKRCTVTEVNKHNVFCCCDSDMCNSDIDLDSITEIFGTTTQASGVSFPSSTFAMVKKILLMSLCPLVVFTIVIVITFYIWRKFVFKATGYKTPSFQAIAVCDKIHELSKLEFLEIVALGCFGPIWKGRLGNKYVAIKVMNRLGESMWKAEKDFYNLASQNHENILRFVAAKSRWVKSDRDNHPSPEFWLITEFHERGSLQDNLKKGVFPLSKVISIAFDISKGLTYLHNSTNPTKLPIAHRDLKSENIFLKEDLTACIADFGLSIILRQNLTNVHGQMGSVRYMAPEVLDGAVNLNLESFLKIDVYSCSLIFWELLSRCSAFDGCSESYLRPFESEIGLHPSIEDMKFLILNGKVRPQIKRDWWEHEISREVCRTIEDCWDHDAEARLPAEAIEQRLSQLQNAAF